MLAMNKRITTRPGTRDHLPRRRDSMRKRRFEENVSEADVQTRFAGITYGGSSKHKALPHLFGLVPSGSAPPDATLCDRDAGFTPNDMSRIPALLDRARRAHLIGNLIWTVDDNGWVYELELTNSGQNEHHGYPLRAGDPFVERVFGVFKEWAAVHGTDDDRNAAEACAKRYGLKP